MKVTLLGMVTEVRPLQYAKAQRPMHPNISSMFSRELNNAKTVKRMVDFLGHHLRIMKKIILILAAMLTLAACTKEGDVIYQTAPSTTPLVTVIYDPNGVGDGNYNDLIYQGVEQAAREHGLRTMQLSPSTREGLSPHPHRERLYPPKLPRRSPGGIRFVAV